MLTDEEMRARMADGWPGGEPFTVCGNGSKRDATKAMRYWLPVIIERYGIQSVNDAGAGDLKCWDWIKDHEGAWNPLPLGSEHFLFGARYNAFDLIPRQHGVIECDITTQVMPRADLILCRMVLNHLDLARMKMALERFKESGSTYLAATTFDGGGPQRAAQFVRWDLTQHLGPYIESVEDARERNCKLALWRL